MLNKYKMYNDHTGMNISLSVLVKKKKGKTFRFAKLI